MVQDAIERILGLLRYIDEGLDDVIFFEIYAETTAKIAEVVTTLDRIVTADLGRIEDRVQRHRRAHQRLAADVDAVSDALDIIVTHIGDQLPEQAKRSVSAKLQRQQRHEITRVRNAAKG